MDAVEASPLPPSATAEKDTSLDARRLALDEAKFRHDTSFTNRHLSTIITSIISVTAVFVSLTQVYLSDRRSQQAVDVQQKESASAMNQQILRDNQEWRFRLAAIVFEHRDMIFSSNPNVRAQAKEVLDATVPADLKQHFFASLERASSQPTTRAAWARAGADLVLSMRASEPTQASLQSSLASYQLARDGRTTIEEAVSMLRLLGVTRITLSTADLVAGVLESGHEIAIWLNTYGKSNCYGIRYGLPDERRSYFGSNDTYFEVCK